MKTARILVIAGSDSGGGAGIQADIKTITMLGGHAMTAITSVTAQNTLGVDDMHPIPAKIVLQQIKSVATDIGVDAIKIGMLGSVETAEAVAEFLKSVTIPIVFDPVMVATSGSLLADARTIASFQNLMAVASIVTPNIPELNALGGTAPILRHGCHLLLKGGHGDGDEIVDQLIGPNGKVQEWRGQRIDSKHTHGTGCSLASAIACGLGQGLDIASACEGGIKFVRLALHNAPKLGKGNGPLGQQYIRNDAVTMGASLNQITIPASNYRGSVDFYAALGMRQIVDSPTNGYARFEGGNGVTLSLHKEDEKLCAAIIYLEHDRLDQWVADLCKLGLTFDQMPQDESWGWREALLKDPHGNVVCLYQAGENRRYPPWRV